MKNKKNMERRKAHPPPTPTRRGRGVSESRDGNTRRMLDLRAREPTHQFAAISNVHGLHISQGQVEPGHLGGFRGNLKIASFRP